MSQAGYTVYMTRTALRLIVILFLASLICHTSKAAPKFGVEPPSYGDLSTALNATALQPGKKALLPVIPSLILP